MKKHALRILAIFLLINMLIASVVSGAFANDQGQQREGSRQNQGKRTTQRVRRSTPGQGNAQGNQDAQVAEDGSAVPVDAQGSEDGNGGFWEEEAVEPPKEESLGDWSENFDGGAFENWSDDHVDGGMPGEQGGDVDGGASENWNEDRVDGGTAGDWDGDFEGGTYVDWDDFTSGDGLFTDPGDDFGGGDLFVDLDVGFEDGILYDELDAGFEDGDLLDDFDAGFEDGALLDDLGAGFEDGALLDDLGAGLENGALLDDLGAGLEDGVLLDDLDGEIEEEVLEEDVLGVEDEHEHDWASDGELTHHCGAEIDGVECGAVAGHSWAGIDSVLTCEECGDTMRVEAALEHEHDWVSDGELTHHCVAEIDGVECGAVAEHAWAEIDDVPTCEECGETMPEEAALEHEHDWVSDGPLTHHCEAELNGETCEAVEEHNWVEVQQETDEGEEESTGFFLCEDCGEIKVEEHVHHWVSDGPLTHHCDLEIDEEECAEVVEHVWAEIDGVQVCEGCGEVMAGQLVVTVTASPGTKVQVGDTVTLTAHVEGMLEGVNYTYYWQRKDGDNWKVIERDAFTCTFVADKEDFTWEWEFVISDEEDAA